MTEKEYLEYLDKLILILPKYKPFNLLLHIRKLESQLNLKNKIEPSFDLIFEKLKHFEYVNVNSFDLNLSKTGIDAQEKGGHFKYLESLKPKKFWKKPEFMIPTAIAIVALIPSFFKIDLDNKEKKEYNRKQEIIAISDSISKALYLRQDSLLQTTNKRIDFLNISLDSLLIKNHSLKMAE